jgi:hypothetical protein
MTKRRKKGTKKPDARPVPPAVTRPAPDAQARESDPIIGYDPGDGREWHELPSGVPVDFFPISTRTDVVQVEIDGLGVTPETVDTMAMLRIAETYLALTLKLADAKRAPFLLTGLRILDKCVAVESVPNDMQRAVFFCGMAASIVDGHEATPYGIEGAAQAAREALRLLPATQRAKVIAGPMTRALKPPPEPLLALRPWERTTIRGRLIRVGGVTCRALFFSPVENNFSLTVVTEERARELGGLLYRELDLEALVARDGAGHIEQGELVHFHVLSDAEPVGAWRDWLKANAPEWFTVEDIIGELDRDAG